MQSPTGQNIDGAPSTWLIAMVELPDLAQIANDIHRVNDSKWSGKKMGEDEGSETLLGYSMV